MGRLLLALMLLCAPCGGEARPFTVEDLLSLESYGQAMAAPGSGLLLVERRRPYRDSPDFGYGGSLVDRTLGRVLAVPLAWPGAGLSPLFPQERGAGYWMGSLSPSGTRLTVFRLRERRLSLGVVDLRDRTVRWLDVAPDLLSRDPAPAWLDERRLLVATTPGGRLPRLLRLGSSGGARLQGLYARQGAGLASWTAVDAGGPRAADEDGSSGRLVVADVDGGRVRDLLAGPIVDFSVSPDRRRVAVVVAGGSVPPPPTPIGVAFRSRRADLTLLALDDVRVLARVPDVAAGLLAWSRSGRLLAVARRRGASDWRDARFVALSRSGVVGALGTAADRAHAPEPSDALRFAAAWSGRDLLALVRRGGGAPGWRLLGIGRSRAVAVPPDAAIVADDGARTAMSTRNGLRLIDRGRVAVPTGGTRVLMATSLDPFSSGDRNDAGPCGTVTLVHDHPNGPTADRDCGGVARPAPREDVLAGASAGLLVRSVDSHGSEALSFVDRRGRRTPVDRINVGMAEVDLPRAVRLESRSPGGAAVVHWLLLPRAGLRPRLVVQPYPGRTFSGEAPIEARPWRNGFGSNALLLTAAGLAVLLPGMPRADDQSPVDDVAPQVDAAVAAARGTGLVDPGCWGVMGHSFGAWAALVLATRERCLSSVVAANGVYDLTAAHATMAGPDRVDLPLDVTFGQSTGWAEAGQGALWSTPELSPLAYRAASPLLAASRVDAPLLLLGGDLDAVDMAQSERMFMEVVRAGGRARLLRFWGEGHTVSSPGNLRAYWREVVEALSRP